VAAKDLDPQDAELTADQKRQILEALKERGKEITAEIMRLKKNVVAPERSADESDVAAANADQAVHVKIVSRLEAQLSKIRHGVQRLNSRDFGYCDQCGCEIGFQRLLARPWSTLCVACKDTEERAKKVRSASGGLGSSFLPDTVNSGGSKVGDSIDEDTIPE
jgi:DnaK suppressor protein